ncbi:MAG: phosphoribosylamine--glycine ligase [Marinilabiliales bacterium]|nr:MAG: phosphoribosylamine--glycine ligase [Marinilabiliales bacterium]
MNILILGSGGREHALAWKISQSDKTDNLFIAPGNAGTREVGTNLPIDINDFVEVKRVVVEKDIDILVVGPEVPLVDGITDKFKNDPALKNISVIGPGKEGAMLEGSKEFAKEFMYRNGIPTAAYKSFNAENIEDGFRFLESLKAPYVLKADGLAAGKGVLILNDLELAKSELKKMIEDSKFGEASAKVVIEEFLDGIELSVFVLTDGKSYVILPEAKDYKRVGEGDTGLNTGGMGSVSPVSFATDDFMKKIEDQIIKPTINGIIKENIDYKGFIFFGLIKVDEEPFVIEYNCRMGDPETESVIPRIKSDLVEAFIAVENQTLEDYKIEFDDRHTAAIMLVSGGYPEAYEKSKVISGIDNLSDCILFHAGTSKDVNTDEVKTSGGRVIAVCSYGDTMQDALLTAYEKAKQIEFEGRYFRTDIGFDL